MSKARLNITFSEPEPWPKEGFVCRKYGVGHPQRGGETSAGLLLRTNIVNGTYGRPGDLAGMITTKNGKVKSGFRVSV